MDRVNDGCVENSIGTAVRRLNLASPGISFLSGRTLHVYHLDDLEFSRELYSRTKSKEFY